MVSYFLNYYWVMKKYIPILLISFFLVSCSLSPKKTTSTEVQKPLPIVPIMSSGSTGATSTGFSEDLSEVIEKAYKDANK